MIDLDVRHAQLISRPPETVLFEVAYGSWAHGTNTPTSDVDWRGVYQLPNDEFLGLGRPKTTWEDKAQDRVFWELGQFCGLLLKGNPNIVGMLFAPGDCLIRTSPAIEQLRAIRHSFISQSMRRAYMGWIEREAKDLGNAHARDLALSGKSHVSVKRLSHLPRLIWELESALSGNFVVRPSDDRANYIRLIKTGALDRDQAFEEIARMLLDIEDLDALLGPKLPEAPREEVQEWLLTIRHA